MAGREDTGTNAKRKLERQLRMGMMTSRRAMMERDKAMDAARNPGVSKFGDCLVNINSKADKMLNSQLNKIKSEIRRMEMQIKQKKKLFVKNSGVLNHDPLILVERPASPEIVKRALTISTLGEKEDPPPIDGTKVPGYMKPLRSRTRTPSTLTTIDAFTVKSKRKKNIWEEAMDEKSAPVFKSTVRPYAKLSSREESDLQLGYSYHKPRLTPETGLYSDTEESNRKTSPVKHIVSEEESGESELDEFTPFITQMAKVRKKKRVARKEKTSVLAELRVIKSPGSPTELKSIKSPVQGQKQDLKLSKNVRFASPIAPSPQLRKGRMKTRATRVAY